MITPLNPSLPVIITSRDNASGECIGWIDYGPEHHLLWITALDSTGEVWIIPNDQIRLHKNISLGRTVPTITK